MDQKIFQIGFNRSATTSLYKWLKSQNIPSLHFELPQTNRNLTLAIHENIRQGKRPLEGFEEYSFYSDMEFVSSTLITDFYTRFAILDHYYPGSKFILNYRNIHDWVRSRSNHGRTGKYAGQVSLYTKRYQEFYGISETEVENLWIKHYYEHINRVIEYFKDSPSQLLIMDLDNFNLDQLIEFLPNYKLRNIPFPISNTGLK